MQSTETAGKERPMRERTSDPTDSRSGGCAFPVERGPADGYAPGMSLRDWFAGLAMQGVWSNRDTYMNCSSEAKRRGVATDESVAHYAYKQADAMLAARETRDDSDFDACNRCGERVHIPDMEYHRCPEAPHA